MLIKFDCASEAVFARLAVYLASDENRTPLPERLGAFRRGFIASLKEAKRTDSLIQATLEVRENWLHDLSTQWGDESEYIKTDPKYMVAIFKIITEQD